MSVWLTATRLRPTTLDLAIMEYTAIAGLNRRGEGVRGAAPYPITDGQPLQRLGLQLGRQLGSNPAADCRVAVRGG